MTLRDISLERTYVSKKAGTNIVRDFYVPLLSETFSYDRLTFTFSSSALAAAARGFAGLIRNNGRMRILASPSLQSSDLETLKNLGDDRFRSEFENLLSPQFESILEMTNKLESDYVSALAWLLRNDQLELRFAVGEAAGEDEEGIFHTKLGIARDLHGNAVSFSGSINESYTAWRRNIERFKVFRNWVEADLEHFNDDNDSFVAYWDYPEENGIRSLSITQALSEMLVSVSPKSSPLPRIEEIQEAEVNRDTSPSPAQGPRKYQLDAVDAWEVSGYKGILAMATGSGKTFTSRLCIERLEKSHPDLVVVVLCPSETIAKQWKAELSDRNPLLLNVERQWGAALEKAVNEKVLGFEQPLTIISTMHRAGSERFLSKIKKLKAREFPILLVADEAHHFGAASIRKCLSEDYAFRLGLSATPDRYFDEEGTQYLSKFFSGTVFEFSIEEALSWEPPAGTNPILTPFIYKPIFVSLNESEHEEYARLTQSIFGQPDTPEGSDRAKFLLQKRAIILKKAESKLAAFEQEVSSRGQISNAIVYCQDEEQVDAVLEILHRKRIKATRFSGESGSAPRKELGGLSERDWILRDFVANRTQVLVAMKILDEGVDLPNARLGFVLASSGNVKEFVQRTGRLIRWAAGKGSAEIVDFLVAPDPSAMRGVSALALAQEFKFVDKELKRLIKYATPALNIADVRFKIYKIMKLMRGSGYEFSTSEEGQ